VKIKNKMRSKIQTTRGFRVSIIMNKDHLNWSMRHIKIKEEKHSRDRERAEKKTHSISREVIILVFFFIERNSYDAK
jgi:hypothetical protein